MTYVTKILKTLNILKKNCFYIACKENNLEILKFSLKTNINIDAHNKCKKM